MTKIALVTDTHYGVKKGDETMAGYFARFFDEVFFPEIDKRGIQHIIHLGDLFDPRSEIATNVFDQVKAHIIDPISARNIRFDMLVGNHDTRYKNTNMINTPATLFDLPHGTKAKRIEQTKFGVLVIDEIYTFEVGKTKISLVPWISHDNEERIIEGIEKLDTHIVMGHFEIAGARMDRVNVSKHGINHSMFNRFPMVLSGHFHHKSKYGNIDYLGTPYEMTWVDSGDPKGFHILDTETMELEFIQNPITMFNTVQYDGETDIDLEALKGTQVRLYINEGVDPVKVNAMFGTIEEVAQKVTITDNRKAITDDITDDNAYTISNDTPEETLELIREYILDKIPEDREEVYNAAIAHINDLYHTVTL